MSAPSGTIWGSIVTGSGSGNYRKGKIGIYTSISNTDKVTTVSVQVWFWTIYSCSDGTNNLYFDIGADATSATTLVGSASISHTVDSGSGWSTSNQTRIWNKTYSYNRRTSNQSCKIYAKFNGIDIISGGTMYASTSVTIPKLATYTVSYNANGGRGAPSSQTKTQGQTLTLSSTKPTRTGYTFKGWTNTSSSTEVIWTAGGPYTINASRTLYAIWKANTYTVSYDANGGTGAPSSQTKTHGQTLTLSSTKPTRTNYNFVGWATSSTATTAAYSAGGSYKTDASDTLYAVWSLAYSKPRITNFSVRRVNTNGQPDDYGTRCKVIFSWATDQAATAVTVSYRQASSGTWTAVSLSSGNTSGSVEQTLSSEFSVDKSYEIKVTVADSAGSSDASRALSSGKFIMDFLSGGNGVTFGSAAESEGFNVKMPASFSQPVEALESIYMGGDNKTNDEKQIHYKSLTNAANPHHLQIYGGNGESEIAIGVHDAKNNRSVWSYNDVSDLFYVRPEVRFGNGFTEDIPVLTSGDCNTILKSGHYYIGASGSNKPPVSANNGWLTVRALESGNYCYQEYVTYTGVRFYRMRDNGTWGSWIQDNDSQNVDTSGTYAASNITWTWQKWRSGIAECWGSFKTTPYKSNGFNSFECYLPFTFASTSYVVLAQPTRNANMLGYHGPMNSNGAIQKETKLFYMSYGYERTTFYEIHFDIRVSGRWK